MISIILFYLSVANSRTNSVRSVREVDWNELRTKRCNNCKGLVYDLFQSADIGSTDWYRPWLPAQHDFTTIFGISPLNISLDQGSMHQSQPGSHHTRTNYNQKISHERSTAQVVHGFLVSILLNSCRMNEIGILYCRFIKLFFSTQSCFYDCPFRFWMGIFKNSWEQLFTKMYSWMWNHEYLIWINFIGNEYY